MLRFHNVTVILLHNPHFSNNSPPTALKISAFFLCNDFNSTRSHNYRCSFAITDALVHAFSLHLFVAGYSTQ